MHVKINGYVVSSVYMQVRRIDRQSGRLMSWSDLVVGFVSLEVVEGAGLAEAGHEGGRGR